LTAVFHITVSSAYFRRFQRGFDRVNLNRLTEWPALRAACPGEGPTLDPFQAQLELTLDPLRAQLGLTLDPYQAQLELTLDPFQAQLELTLVSFSAQLEQLCSQHLWQSSSISMTKDVKLLGLRSSQIGICPYDALPGLSSKIPRCLRHRGETASLSMAYAEDVSPPGLTRRVSNVRAIEIGNSITSFVIPRSVGVELPWEQVAGSGRMMWRL